MKLLLLVTMAGFLYLQINALRGISKLLRYALIYRNLKNIKNNFLKHGYQTAETPPPIDLLFVIDASYYYRHNYRDALSAIRITTSFFSISPGTTRVAIITYNEKITIYSTFSKYHNRVELNKLLYRISKAGPTKYLSKSSIFPSHFNKTNIGGAIEAAANLFNTSFTRPNTLKLMVTFTTGRGESGNDRVKFKIAMNSLTDQKIKRLVFAAKKTQVVKELSSNKYENLFLLSGYRLKNTVSKLYWFIWKKGDYDRCYSYGEVSDECNRRCSCVSGRLRNCKRMRYEFNSMPKNEKVRFVKTLRKLTTDATHRPRYERFIKIHSANFFSRIHQSSEFLPWHRWFILEMENLLKEVDCRVTVPYWDWSLVSNDPFNNTMLFSDDYLGSHPAGVYSCVEEGPFGTKTNWTIEAGGCLERWFRGNAPSVAEVQRVINAPSFRTFEILLRVALHDFVHCMIGGTMCFVNSANAPSFFLHHGFIDKIWWDAQQKNKVFFEGHFQEQMVNMVASPYRPNQLLNLTHQPGYIHVEYANATVNNASEIKQIIQKLTIQDLLRLPRVMISRIPLDKALKVFKVTKEEKNIVKQFWLVTVKHTLPLKKLTGSFRQLGFNVKSIIDKLKSKIKKVKSKLIKKIQQSKIFKHVSKLFKLRKLFRKRT